MSKFHIFPTKEQLSSRLPYLFGLLLIIQIVYRSNSYWVFDILSHFQIQYLLACVLGIAISLWTKQRTLNYGFIVLVLIIGIPIAKYWRPQKNSTNTQRHNLCIASFNVNTSNTEKEYVIAEINKLNPDIILLLEVNSEWTDALDGMPFKFKMICPQPDNFGIAIYSKLPIEGSIQKFEGLPYIDCRINGLRILGAHTLPPIGTKGFQTRNAELNFLATKCEADTVLLGDLNITPFSTIFKEFLAKSKLKESIIGYGIYPTWGRINPLVTLPLDHILIGNKIEIKDFAIQGNYGSDHNLITARLQY